MERSPDPEITVEEIFNRTFSYSYSGISSIERTLKNHAKKIQKNSTSEFRGYIKDKLCTNSKG